MLQEIFKKIIASVVFVNQKHLSMSDKKPTSTFQSCNSGRKSRILICNNSR